MGNSFKKQYFYLHCLHCNSTKELEESVFCCGCNNILLTKKIDEDITFNLKNYESKIKFVEQLCLYTNNRIFIGYNYIKKIFKNQNIILKFKNQVNLHIDKPSGESKNWDRPTKIIFFINLIDHYNSLIDINYKLYEALLGNILINNMYNNFSISKMKENPPSYEQIFTS